MRLAMFRERLLREVEEADALPNGDQNIQPYVSCIAALLRKIMTRTGDHATIRVKVYERGDGADINVPRWESVNVGFLVNKILHYQEFLPAVDPATLDDTKWTCTIVCDKDGNVLRRLVDIDDFLGVAKSMATDDEAILARLLRHVRTRLGRIVHAHREPHDSDTGELEAVESLIDVFDLARAMEKDASMEGAIEVHSNMRKGMMVVGVRTWSVSYTTLVRNLFKSWTLVPFRQFHSTIEGKGKMLDVVDHHGGILMIGAEDMMDFLGSAQTQWGKGAVPTQVSRS